ncbi:hypothetical protein D3D02_16905 [Halobellus sp. Atlit-38R]|nr:hypothetical protein D3D02_16905 [Halobellus sp. Atlit-38R]
MSSERPGDDGNHYICAGTWVRDRSDSSLHTLGVVSRVCDAHESGTLVIEWFPNATQHISQPMFLEKLRCGRWAIDDGEQLHTGGGCGA